MTYNFNEGDDAAMVWIGIAALSIAAMVLILLYLALR